MKKGLVFGFVVCLCFSLFLLHPNLFCSFSCRSITLHSPWLLDLQVWYLVDWEGFGSEEQSESSRSLILDPNLLKFLCCQEASFEQSYQLPETKSPLNSPHWQLQSTLWLQLPAPQPRFSGSCSQFLQKCSRFFMTKSNISFITSLLSENASSWALSVIHSRHACIHVFGWFVHSHSWERVGQESLTRCFLHELSEEIKDKIY